MERYSRFLGIMFVFLLPFSARSDQKFLLESPDGLIKVEFHIGQKIFYNVEFRRSRLIENAQLGLVLKEGGAFTDLKLTKKEELTADSFYSMPFGKTKNIRDHFKKFTFTLQEAHGLNREIKLIFKIYDDGIAFRYLLPEQQAFKDFIISDETTSFSLVQNPTVYGLPLPFGSSYEGYYRQGKIDAFKPDETLGLPLLLEYSNGQYVAFTEADLTDYAGMYLASSKNNPNTLEARLAPSLDDATVKVRGQTPFSSPWRVIMLGNSPKTLLESDIIYNLNPPSKIADTSWIKPGKVQFPWWNGYVVPNPDPDHNPGINTWTLKHYIDFCAENKIADHSIDGFDQAWYGGTTDPFQATDITHPIAEINMPEVLNYARLSGVRTRLWMHWAGLAQNIDQALATYESWGVEGIMVDFLNRDDQEMIRFYNEVLKKTALHHLTVTFHGVFKPTGQARTYPHLLNHESVLGTEYNKWSDVGSPPAHEVLIAFIRMLAGPLDTHEGSFRPVAPENFHASYIAPRTMGTLARQLAMYVVYENHLPMLADYPEAYASNPSAFEFIKKVPVIWDKTRYLAGIVGKFIVMARKKDSDWYIGSITDSQSRTLKIPLGFLGKGKYIAEIYEDSADFLVRPEKIMLKNITVTSSDSLDLTLAPAGGAAIHIYQKDTDAELLTNKLNGTKSQSRH